MIGRFLRNVLLAAAMFAVCTTAIRAWIPWPDSYGLRAKYEHFRAHANRYDTLFFGSSLTFRAIIPEVIDRRFAGSETPRSSYNFGIPGATAFEVDYILGEILALAAPVLRDVVVEHMRWKPRAFDEADDLDDRAVYWHSLRVTGAVVRTVLAQDDPLLERCQVAWNHVRLMVRRYTNYAEGGALLDAVCGRPVSHAYLSSAEADAQRGYQDPDILLTTDNIDSANARQRTALFLAQHREYEEQVAETEAWYRQLRENRRRQNSVLDKLPLTVIRQQVASIEARGLRVTYLMPPSLGPADDAFALRDAGIYPDLIVLSDPTTQPELFRTDHRFDRAHLNRRGAVAFSQAFVSEYRRHQPYRDKP